jgi:hypothetical protein
MRVLRFCYDVLTVKYIVRVQVVDLILNGNMADSTNNPINVMRLCVSSHILSHFCPKRSNKKFRMSVLPLVSTIYYLNM